ncbi:MAG: hypothetical protein GQ532_09880 [Methylomarinum sp.]|nr:hypothetical protein [Methylomarinum sp.]
MTETNLEEMVLNKIREINIDKPADQGELLHDLPMDKEALLAALSSLYDNHRISMPKPPRTSKRVGMSNIYVGGFLRITAN